MKSKSIVASLVAAALILGISVGLKYLVSTGSLDVLVSKRIMGAIVGLVLAVWGNYMPKTLKPMSEKSCDSSRWVSLRRFAGWAFVVSGLSYSAVWIFAPMEHTRLISMTIVGFSVVLVLTLMVWVIISRKRSQPPAKI